MNINNNITLYYGKKGRMIYKSRPVQRMHFYECNHKSFPINR